MFDSLRGRIVMLFAGTVLVTTLTITFFVQLKTEQQATSTQVQQTRNLLQTVLLNVANEYESYLFYRQALLRERKGELENITALALRQVEGFYEQYRSGGLSEQEAQQEAIAVVRRMRYAGDLGYLWIQDTGQPYPRLLMHAKQPRLEGKTAEDDPLFYAALDGKGNLFTVFTELCLRQGQGFVNYRWPKPAANGMADMQPKTAHLRYFKPWGWIIGTGLYMDDIERDSRKRLDAIKEELQRTFSQLKLGNHGHVFLFSGKGDLLVAPDVVGLDLRATDPETGTVLLDALKQAARSAEPLLHSDWPADGESVVRPSRTYVVRFAPLEWYIGATLREEELQAPGIELRWKVLAIALFFVTLAIVLAWRLAISLSLPLARLAKAARQIEQGGAAHDRIPISGSRETRDLGTCLAAMLHSMEQVSTEKELLVQELRQSEEDLRTTVNSIGDAVIATDINGCITRMNPVAEALTGWYIEEIRGQSLAECFHIIDSRTRSQLEDPVRKVLATGKHTGLANHTALIAKDGREFQIADSASPIKDDQGRITGVVLVFRDVTDEYRIRETLRATEELQRGVFSNTPSIIYIKDLQGSYLFVNRMYENLFHITNETLKGKTARNLFPSEQAELFHRNDIQVIESGDTLELEETLTLDDGEHIYMSVKFPLKRASGETFAVCGIATDITERKRTEIEYRRSSERLRLALQASSMGTWNWDLQKNRVVWSPETLDIFGVSDESFGGTYEAYLSFLPRAIKEETDRYVTAFLNEPPQSGVIHYEHPILTGNGESKWIEVRGTLFANEDGCPTQMTGVCADVTERKQQEGELRQLRNSLSNIINSMPSVLIGVDREGNVTQWNQTAQRVTEISDEEALGQPLAKVFPRLATEMGRVFQAMQTRQEQMHHARPYRANDDIRYEDLTIYPLIADGVEGAVIRIDDVTERLLIEKMMIQTEKMLSVGGLAAGMAHEINNPLGGIMQTSEVMTQRLAGDLPANKQAAEEVGVELAAIHAYMEKRSIPRMLEAIRDAGRRAAAIVDNMLGFARMEDDTVFPCDIETLLEQTIQLSGTDYDLKKHYDFKQIEIVREYEEGVPTVICSPQKLQQVFLNILKNGAQAMQEMDDKADKEMSSATRQKARFVLRLLHETKTDMVRIEIADNGPGMDETTRKRVFEPFFTTKPVGVGTGLGLSVSYFIITESLGGTMSVESEPGAGSTFIIRLPLLKK